MKTDDAIVQNIRDLINSQQFGVLSTSGSGQTYASLIAYSVTDDMKRFYFTTSVATRKFKLLCQNCHVALLIDNRCDHREHFTQIGAVTVTGAARQIKSGAEYDQGVRMLTSRHTYLRDFIHAPSTALVRVDTVRFLFVTRFQEVFQWVP